MIYWLLFITSFLGTYYVMPHSIRKLKENNYVVKDMYKNNVTVPTNAGTIILFTSFVAISLSPLLIRIFNVFLEENSTISDINETNLAFMLVVSLYAIYGLVDDLVDIGRKLKLIFPVLFSYPLLGVINVNSVWIPLIGDLDLTGEFYSNIFWNDIFSNAFCCI